MKKYIFKNKNLLPVFKVIKDKECDAILEVNYGVGLMPDIKDKGRPIAYAVGYDPDLNPDYFEGGDDSIDYYPCTDEILNDALEKGWNIEVVLTSSSIQFKTFTVTK